MRHTENALVVWPKTLTIDSRHQTNRRLMDVTKILTIFSNPPYSETRMYLERISLIQLDCKRMWGENCFSLWITIFNHKPIWPGLYLPQILNSCDIFLYGSGFALSNLFLLTFLLLLCLKFLLSRSFGIQAEH